MDLDTAVETAFAAARLKTPPDQSLGLAAVTVHGQIHGAGHWQQPFAIQSIAKVFALAQVLAIDGETLWSRTGRRPSSRPYNAIAELDLDSGIPRNPLLNGGGLVITDRLLELTGGQACHGVLEFLRTESANSSIHIDPDVAQTERASADRNLAIAHLIAAYQNLRMPVPTVVDHYVWQCSIMASCRDVALAGLFLARDGLRNDGQPFLTQHGARAINATMLACGAYEASADVAHRVGMPLKTGVGGGILAVAPGLGTVCVWGPELDASGSSVSGLLALEHVADLTGWSVV